MVSVAAVLATCLCQREDRLEVLWWIVCLCDAGVVCVGCAGVFICFVVSVELFLMWLQFGNMLVSVARQA